jgi:8-oxo-dGTP pyrophosphatase MutT (NUDIX family)
VTANPGSTAPDDRRPWTRIGAYALCVSDGRLLACRAAATEVEAGWWTLPGGGIDFGEAPDVGALRELEEETGLVGRVDDLVALYSELLPANERRGPVHSLQAVYRVTIVGGELRSEIDGSSDLAAWLTPLELERTQRVELLRRATELAFPASAAASAGARASAGGGAS